MILAALALAAILVAGHATCVRAADRAAGTARDRAVIRRAIDRMEARQ